MIDRFGRYPRPWRSPDQAGEGAELQRFVLTVGPVPPKGPVLTAPQGAADPLVILFALTENESLPLHGPIAVGAQEWPVSHDRTCLGRCQWSVVASWSRLSRFGVPPRNTAAKGGGKGGVP